MDDFFCTAGKDSPEELKQKMSKIITYANIISTILLTISALFILINLIKSLLIKKYDKNKNGKLDKSEKEEILKENHDYIMSFLGDTLKVITKGIMNDIGCKIETAEKLILKSFNEMTEKNEEIKAEYNEEITKKEEIEKQNALNQKLKDDMEKRIKLENEVESLKKKIMEKNINEQ